MVIIKGLKERLEEELKKREIKITDYKEYREDRTIGVVYLELEAEELTSDDFDIIEEILEKHGVRIKSWRIWAPCDYIVMEIWAEEKMFW